MPPRRLSIRDTMQTPKTISDLPRWLREQFETFQHLDTFGLPDHGDFDGFDAAALVNECQRVACGFGAPLVGDEQTVTSIRAGVETFGRLLAWAVVRAHDGAHDAGRRLRQYRQRKLQRSLRTSSQRIMGIQALTFSARLSLSV